MSLYIDIKIEDPYWPGLLGPDPHWLQEERLAAGGDSGHGGGQRRGAGAGAALYCTVLGVHCTALYRCCTGGRTGASAAPTPPAASTPRTPSSPR